MAIIAGGLATRLRHLSKDRPKSMISIDGKPFLQYQIELLKNAGVNNIVLCVGHFSDQIKNYFGDGKKFGVQVQYSDEGKKLLGTGGALKKAELLLENEFFVMWGDSYLMLDYKDIWNSYSTGNNDGMMVVYKNFSVGDKSNVVVKNDKVVVYDKWSQSGEMVYIDNGISVLSKKILQDIPENSVFALENIFKKLAEEKKLGAYVTKQRFYEIGSVSGLEEFKEFAFNRRLYC